MLTIHGMCGLNAARTFVARPYCVHHDVPCGVRARAFPACDMNTNRLCVYVLCARHHAWLYCVDTPVA